MDSEHVELNQITLEVRDVQDVIRTSEVVRGTLEKFHPQKDFAVVVPLELLKQAEQLRQIFNVVLGSIAAISLVVGGIGIMNIMLATVTERTREIGIRRALGARRRDIIEQFLTETVVLSGTGGMLGIVLGLLTPFAFRMIRSFALNFVLDPKTLSNTSKMFQEMQPEVAPWSLPLAFGISVGIGILFGLYPAQAAAKLDPIEALRHE
jgi:putative ABC transport system permease protein